MLQSKNMLAMCMQIFSITCLITFLWLCFGYSLAFSPSSNDDLTQKQIDSMIIYGDAKNFWLLNVKFDSFHMNANTIPESVYCTYQLTFAIITAALICGSVADRMKYFPFMLFIALWHLLVYCPIAHTMWSPAGLFYQYGVLDFAGGNVVHISSGVTGLVAALFVGNRSGWKPREETHPPFNTLLTFMGMSMLWIGWFGFNAGSATAAGNRAGMAMMVTMIATAVGSLSWMLTQFVFTRKPGILGMISGAIAGLVCITPASGFVDPNGAFWIGLIGGSFCYFGAHLKNYVLGIDDALDAFGVHAIGGIIGGIMTAFFASPQICAAAGSMIPNTAGVSTFTGQPFCTTGNGIITGNAKNGAEQLRIQLAAIAFSIAWSGFGTFILLCLVKLITGGLRVSKEDEEMGLDKSLHGESIDDGPGTEEKSPVHAVDGDKVFYEDNPSATGM